ncbi:putative transcription factor MYB-HB-like family [Helianthus anomalus]
MDGPNIRHGEFSEEEDIIICCLYASIGSRWSLIAAQLPGRTGNDIKYYWNTKLKEKVLTFFCKQKQVLTMLPYFQEETSFFPSIPFQPQPPSNDHLTSHQFLNILSDTSYNNEHVSPSLGLMAMARLQLSEPLNDISYNNEKATSVGSVAMVRLQLSDQLIDTCYSYSNEQAPSVGYERGLSQFASDGLGYYARPPSLTDVAGRDESYSGENTLVHVLIYDGRLFHLALLFINKFLAM